MSCCQTCGEPISQPPRGGRRRFCSERCRKAQYGGTCEVCVARTYGGDGPGNAPTLCIRHGTRNAIAARRARRDERRELVARLWAEGLPAREIAPRVGLAVGSLNQEIVRMRQEGWPLTYRRSTGDTPSERSRVITDLWRAGFTARYIAEQAGTSPAAVRSHVSQLRKRGVDLEYRHPRFLAAA